MVKKAGEYLQGLILFLMLGFISFALQQSTLLLSFVMVHVVYFSALLCNFAHLGEFMA